VTHRDPHREFLDQMRRAIAKQIDRDIMGDLSKHSGGFLIPLGQLKAVWTEEDEPMTELTESVVRGNWAKSNEQLRNKLAAQTRECDCPACMARVEDERRMWAEIGIDVFGEEVRRDGE